MIFKLQCKKCLSTNKLNGNFNDRWDLEKKMESRTSFKCKYCNNEIHLNPNDVTAHLNIISVSVIIFIILFVLAVVSYIIFYNLNFNERYLKVVFLLYMLIVISIFLNLIIGSMFKRVNNFNKYRL